MKRRKTRQLRSDESDLWEKVARTARPMHGARATKTLLEKSKDASLKAPKGEEPKFELAPFRIGSRSTASPTAERSAVRAEKPTLNMDRGAFRRMKKGKTKPDARIDLHGMTVEAAHSALTAFLFRAHASGKRLVLVITGKGRPGTDDGPIPTRTGALRNNLPVWVSRPPLASIVQQVTEAHTRHGGSGAFYVYLRRAR